MKISFDQRHYWNKVTNAKNFKHEIDWSFVQKNTSTTAHILDVGCGYGRLLNQFSDYGYEHLIGIDNAEEMIKCARESNKCLDVRHHQEAKLPFKDAQFDMVLLFAVLTCVPLNEDQEKIVAEINRVLKPTGLLYISDLLISSDARNINRYNAYDSNNYGTFQVNDEVVLRHHDCSYLENELMRNFNICYKKEFEVTTMNGNKANGIQLIGKPSTNNIPSLQRNNE